jgi:hypothetical protein
MSTGDLCRSAESPTLLSVTCTTLAHGARRQIDGQLRRRIFHPLSLISSRIHATGSRQRIGG